MDRLLNLDRLSWYDPQTALGFRYPMPAWVWVLLTLAALTFAGWSYRHLLPGRAARVMLTLIRTALLLAMIMLLAGPMLIRREERMIPDWLVFLVDRSASLNMTDAKSPDHPGAITREQSLRSALEKHRQALIGEKLGEHRQVLWLGFDQGIYNLDDPTRGLDKWAPPTGRTTALRTALDQTLQRLSGRPVAGIVLITDGRSFQPTSASLVKRMQREGAAVFPVALGGQIRAVDLDVAQLTAPEKAFIHDQVPVLVQLDRYPRDAALDLSRYRLQLVDPQTQDVLDQRELDETAFSKPITLVGQSSLAGPLTWQVRLVDAGGNNAAAEVDPVRQNNQQSVQLEFIDRPIRVLYIDGYPRWEYRYLKTMLLRETSIASSMYLLSADRGFAQEGDEPITRVPDTAEELLPYDVIIIGDVPPTFFSASQMQLLRNQVALQGAGLLWLAGDQATPRAYGNTPLADLLPMRDPAGVRTLTGAAWRIAPTHLARALNVLALRSDEDPTGRTWPRELPPLRWVQSLGPLKPTAELLATMQNGTTEPEPNVVRMRYGSGQSIYVGTDETWRWRLGRGDVYFQQYWTGLIRMLGRHRVQQNLAQARFEIATRRVVLGQSVLLEITVDDPMLAQSNLARLAVDAVLGQGDAARTTRIELLRQPTQAQEQAAVLHYQTLWQPDAAGQWELHVVEPALVDLKLIRTLTVLEPDDEMTQPAPDHQRLIELARQTGGEMINLDELDQLTAKVPVRAVPVEQDQTESLWDSPLALFMITLLLTLEWLGRKWVRLA